jgi:hypothetical protein
MPEKNKRRPTLAKKSHYYSTDSFKVKQIILSTKSKPKYKATYDSFTGVYSNCCILYVCVCENRCHVIGGGPTSDIRVHIGKRELTADMQLTRASSMTGNRCMRREQHVATKWSEQFEATSSDDQASLNCSVAMAAGQLPVNSREVMLHVRCKQMISLIPSDFCGKASSRELIQKKSQPLAAYFLCAIRR